MTDLRAEAVPADSLSGTDRDAMFALMDAVYAGMVRERFETDLAAKDTCITLRTPDGELAGFSTQTSLSITVDEVTIDGVFSGDTVIAPAHWGSPALMRCFAGQFIAGEHPLRYWFLISKGHRTYRMLTTFFADFFPRRDQPTPPQARSIMDAYATALYGTEYNPATGVLEYHQPKDRLRVGAADISERELRIPTIAFFNAANPGWSLGHDLVCLCELSEANVVPRMRSVLGLGAG
ncbi:MAG: hypothetical protein K4304_03020 [Propionicimonas sp.]